MSSDPSNWPSTFRALRHRNYRLYFFGQLVSLIGTWVQTAALTWLAYELTNKSLWPALVNMAYIVPGLLLSVWGGGLADRLPRRPLIFAAQASQLLMALVLACMVILDVVTPVGLVVVAALIGVGMAIDTPARLAFIMDIVGRDDLMNAVALGSLCFNVARAVGPALSGPLMKWMGPAACFLVNAVTFAAVLGALLAMRLPPQATPVQIDDQGSVLEGFRHLVRRRDLLLLVLMACMLAFFNFPLMALLPAVSTRLGTGEQGYSWMLSGVGAGALVGALVVASFGTHARRVFLMTLGIGLGFVALLWLALTTSLTLAVASCALSGLGLILFFSTGQATLQLGAGEHNRGRVMGIWLMLLSGAQPAGNLLFAHLADTRGVRLTLLVGVVGVGVAAGLVSVLALSWRKRPLAVQQMGQERQPLSEDRKPFAAE